MIERPDILDEVKNMIEDVNNFKTTQQSSGRSFVNYSVSSSNSYDFSISVNTSNKAFRLTFTQSEPTKYNIVDLSYFFRIDNSAVMADPYVSNAPPYTVEVVLEKPQLGITTWILDCTNNNAPTSHTFYFKFYFNGTVDGTFSAVAL